MHIPSHHYHKPLRHCKCPHNNDESRESVYEEEVNVETHATQMTTVLSSCQSHHHHCVSPVFHHCRHTDMHSLCCCCSFCNDLCGVTSVPLTKHIVHHIQSTPHPLPFLFAHAIAFVMNQMASHLSLSCFLYRSTCNVHHPIVFPML